ncbi:MAG: DUF975 family protein, partial [Coriobacteriales bacterium]|nr:DUF975 family protein [Coriobacteriales bacterium]
MRDRRSIKASARGVLRRNYLVCFIACIIWVFVVDGVFSPSQRIASDAGILRIASDAIPNPQVSTTLNNILDTLERAGAAVQQATSWGGDSSKGLIHDLYSRALESRGYLDSLITTLGEMLAGRTLSQTLLALAGAAALIVLFYFLEGTFEAGMNRLFLESRLYPKTGLTRLLFIFRVRRVRKLLRVVFLKLLYLVLWACTIVGFPIKYYSYYLVPFIMAENPDTPWREVFKLSARMMRGNRWRVFRFDVSFWYWHLLGVLSLGIARYFFFNPYLRAAKAELYATLRARAKETAMPGTEYLNDDALFALPEGELPKDCLPGHYPVPLSRIPLSRGRHWLDVTVKPRYSLLHLGLMFFIFAVGGWGFEVLLALAQHGILVNHGMLFGPWLPLWGFGGLLILILNKYADKPGLVFVATFFISGVLEYTAATAIWEIFHLRYWDYSGFFFNIQGRICLEGLLTFAIAGTASIYFLVPLLDNLLEKIP